MKTIIRTRYLERIKALKDTPDIKIITGIRRSGKSNLMQTYIDYLKTNFEDANIIFIDYMDLEFEEIKEYHALHKFVEDRYEKEKKNYLFVDEVQLCPKFELAINSLYSKNKYDIYITGSNAFLLSADWQHCLREDILKFTCSHLVLRNIVSIMMNKATRTNCLKNILSRVAWQVRMYITLIWIEQPILKKYMKRL